MSVVYFITYENGPIKIGTAKDLKKRLISIQNGCPFKLQVLGTIPGDRDDEQDLHRKFHYCRMSGEWFERDQELLEYIERNATLSFINRKPVPAFCEDVSASHLSKEELLRRLYKMRCKLGNLKDELRSYKDYQNIDDYNHKIQRSIIYRGMKLFIGHNIEFLSDVISSSLCEVFTTIQKLDREIDGIKKDLYSQHKAHWLSHNEFKKLLRREVDCVFDTRWMTSRDLLVENGRESLEIQAKKKTREILKKSWDEALHKFKPIFVLNQSQNDGLKNLEVAMGGNHG